MSGRPPGTATACEAPSSQLFLNPQGDVAPCCRRLVPYGNVGSDSLLDLWWGAERRRLEAALVADDYSHGCEACGDEVATEGWEGSYPASFGSRRRHDAGARWPAWIDFNLSNACNLQCVQCSGELSSAIRTHREHRPPLPPVYDERFYADLRQIVPHLEGAHFAGGEPFLAPENHRVWDLIAELRPDLPVVITTNGTIWNDRVVRVLEQLRPSIVVSIDAIRPDTYRAIRVGGELDPVLEHVDRFVAATGGRVSINHCLMVQNHHEFLDLLAWADDRDLHVDVSVVRAPTHCSIARLPAPELRAVHDGLLAQDLAACQRLGANLETWRVEVDRIGAWADAAERGAAELDRWGETVVTLRRHGRGPTDPDVVAAELAAFADDGVVHRIEVGADDVIRSCSPSLLDRHGVEASSLVGRHWDAVGDVWVSAFGEVRRHEDLGATDDRRDLRILQGDVELRIALVAARGPDGVADHGVVLLAVRPAEGR